jgi:DNA-binding CsgD family transcriptional regulator
MHDQEGRDVRLTHREIQILELVAQGYSAKEVAQAIHVAPRTVESHIDTIRLKLRARNRTHMVAIAADILTAEGHLKTKAVKPRRTESPFGSVNQGWGQDYHSRAHVT